MTVYEWVLAAAAFITAGGVLWRVSHLAELIRGTRLFLLDWNGEPARPGAQARPSVLERIERVEGRTSSLNHDLRGELTSRLTLLAYSVDRLHEHTTSTADTLARLDERISDHRRRNEDQIALLREAVARNETALTDLQSRAQRVRGSDPQGDP